MIVEAQVTINGSKSAAWAAMTNIANADEIISGIEKIEIVERPATGLIGLKWKETRILFGKPATVEKWITEAKENEFYTTRAEDGGFVFLTTMRIVESAASVTLASAHETRPQGFVAQLKSLPMVFFKGMIKKAILQDLNDIKGAVEKAGNNPARNVSSDEKNPWPFDQSRRCATMTTRQVMKESEPILLVSHDAEDHGWQFIGSSSASMADAMVVALEEIVQVDPTVLEVADLEPGWEATRTNVGGSWIRREHPPIPEEER